ncbi:unnamed protein product [Owenia fusiformis]|uniref:Uncharacterized protein n=1 Tax=Owenia fusiformis TaxID=6347 RepID=A0A8J1THH3_OWEFU|nr:unnamed protein product [Owenia fusiformis]
MESGNRTGLNNATTDNNFEMTSDDTSIYLFVVILVGAILLLTTIVGLLNNVTFVASMFFYKRTKKLKYSLLISIAFADIILCLIWSPMEVSRIVLLYRRTPMSDALCSLSPCMFIFCIMVILLSLISITIQWIFRLFSDNSICLAWVNIAELTVTWFFSISIAVMYGTSFHGHLHHKVCVNGYLYADAADELRAPKELAITVLAMYVIIIVIAIVTIIVFINKKSLSPSNHYLPLPNSDPSKPNTNTTETKDIQKLDHNDKDTKPISESDSNSVAQNSGTNQTKAKKEFGLTKKLLFSSPRKDKKSSPASKQPKNAEDDEEDDIDDCDNLEKFRQSLKNRFGSALSGRRHTVANVSLGTSSSDFHSKSTDDLPSSHKASGYNYVRKWSVDVTALMAQLEDPKTHGCGRTAFQELQMLKPNTSATTIDEVGEEDTKINGNAKNEIQKDKKNLSTSFDENPTIIPDKEAANAVSANEEPPQKPNHSKDINAIPIIIVDDDNGNQAQEQVEGNNIMEEPLENSLTSQSSDANTPAKVSNAKLHKQQTLLYQGKIHSLKACLWLIILFSIFTLPYLILQTVQSHLSLLMYLNTTLCVVAFAVIQTTFHAMVFAYMDKLIKKALRRLQQKSVCCDFVFTCKALQMPRVESIKRRGSRSSKGSKSGTSRSGSRSSRNSKASSKVEV